MIKEIASEISSYLQHHDYSLAVRRMLDMSLDIGDKELISETIKWSSDFHDDANNNAEIKPAFFERASSLLRIAITKEPVFSAKQQRLVTAKRISKKYNTGHFSLKPVDLEINAGNIFGVVGENGNGKTTLLRSLGGQLFLDAGELQYHFLSNPDRYSVKSHIAFIPQRIPRWYGQLKDNLHFSAAIAGVNGNENDIMVDFMLERFNLSRFAHLNWNQISSGYRTRFEIARILLQKPDLLILDEPLANLDINAQQTILTDLRFMAKSIYHPMGVLLSSQQLHEVEKVADTVLFIKNGECIFQSNQQNKQPAVVTIELETTSARDNIIAALNDETAQVQFNGNYFTVTSTIHTPQEILQKLIQENISVSYFRDITYSTKRFF
ncbi:MAG: ABC transporter ATP-binding protein [Chitinophagaceae bacterium]